MPKKISSMKKQTSTTKYAVHGHSHDHLFHLLEQLQVPLDKLSEHAPHSHCNVQELAYCPLFRGMTQREHDAFLDRNVREILTFKKGETVVRQGDPIHSVFLRIRAVVRLKRISVKGIKLKSDIL